MRNRLRAGAVFSTYAAVKCERISVCCQLANRHTRMDARRWVLPPSEYHWSIGLHNTGLLLECQILWHFVLVVCISDEFVPEPTGMNDPSRPTFDVFWI